MRADRERLDGPATWCCPAFRLIAACRPFSLASSWRASPMPCARVPAGAGPPASRVATAPSARRRISTPSSAPPSRRGLVSATDVCLCAARRFWRSASFVRSHSSAVPAASHRRAAPWTARSRWPVWSSAPRACPHGRVRSPPRRRLRPAWTAPSLRASPAVLSPAFPSQAYGFLRWIRSKSVAARAVQSEFSLQLPEIDLVSPDRFDVLRRQSAGSVQRLRFDDHVAPDQFFRFGERSVEEADAVLRVGETPSPSARSHRFGGQVDAGAGGLLDQPRVRCPCRWRRRGASFARGGGLSQDHVAPGWDVRRSGRQADVPGVRDGPDVDLVIAKRRGLPRRPLDALVERPRAQDAEAGRELVAAIERSREDRRLTAGETESHAVGTRTEPFRREERTGVREPSEEAAHPRNQFLVRYSAAFPVRVGLVHDDEAHPSTRLHAGAKRGRRRTRKEIQASC